MTTERTAVASVASTSLQPNLAERRGPAVRAEESEPPPLGAASELLADGLIDVHFAATPRGRHALATRP